MLALKAVCTVILITLEIIANLWPEMKIKSNGVLSQEVKGHNFPYYILMLITLRVVDILGYLMIRKWAHKKTKIHVIDSELAESNDLAEV